jgi:hypothetical protein
MQACGVLYACHDAEAARLGQAIVADFTTLGGNQLHCQRASGHQWAA